MRRQRTSLVWKWRSAKNMAITLPAPQVPPSESRGEQPPSLPPISAHCLSLLAPDTASPCSTCRGCGFAWCGLLRRCVCMSHTCAAFDRVVPKAVERCADLWSGACPSATLDGASCYVRTTAPGCVGCLGAGSSCGWCRYAIHNDTGNGSAMGCVYTGRSLQQRRACLSLLTGETPDSCGDAIFHPSAPLRLVVVIAVSLLFGCVLSFGVMLLKEYRRRRNALMRRTQWLQASVFDPVSVHKCRPRTRIAVARLCDHSPVSRRSSCPRSV